MDDSIIVIGSMATIGLVGSIVQMSQGNTPFKPIIASLIGMVFLGTINVASPKVAKGLAIVALLSVTYKYGPELAAILGGK